MEVQKEPEAFNLRLNKNVRITLGNGQTVLWPAESHQLDQLERTVAQRSYAAWEKKLQPLFEKAQTVLKGDNTTDQLAFFDVVVAELTKPTCAVTAQEIRALNHPMGAVVSTMGSVVSKGRLEGVLLNVVLYCQAKNKGKGTQGIWDIVCADKKYIDAQSFEDISLQDKQLLCCMYKELTFQSKCLNKKGCLGCISGVNGYFADQVVDTCCQDKVNLGAVCEPCSKRIKRALLVRTREIVYGLAHFGVPMESEQHKTLFEWACKAKF